MKTNAMILSKFNLTNRIALVTGAGKGIGKGIAISLAEAGADVTAVARTSQDVEISASEIRNRGRKSLALALDVRDNEQVKTMVEKTIAEFGRIDILVNNVGGSFSAPFMEISEKGWDTVLSVNLKTCFLCTQCVLRHMISRKSGAIVNIASGAGITPTPNQSHYGAAKAGVINLTESVASEVAEFGIRVNCIAAGPIATEPFLENISQAKKGAMIQSLAIKRFGTPQDIALATIFLASDAAEWVTGKTFPIDGGYRATHSHV